MEKFLNSSIYDVKPSPIRVFSEMAKKKEGCISLTLGEPDFDTPKKIRDCAKNSLDNGETHYIQNNGDENLRKAICEFEKKTHNVSYNENEIIVTVGATEGLFTALFGILNEGDEVIVPTPAFGLYESIIKLCKGKFIPLYTGDNDFQISEEMLEEKITEKTKAIILNTPNNPTGCILSKESLENVRRAVGKRNIFVICDDVYRGLSYVDECPSFADFKELKEKIILIQSYSKPYAMTGWRIGYLAADEKIKVHLQKIHQYSVVSACSFSQKACIEALGTDTKEMLKVYKKRRDYVLERLTEMGLEAVKPEGGFYVFPSIEKFGLTSFEFCTRLIEENLLAVTPGFCFGSDKYIRLTYCYNEKELKEGLDRLEQFIRKLSEENDK